MKNLTLYVLGGITVFGGFIFLKKKREDKALAAAASGAMLPPAGPKETVSANNSTGSINYTPTTTLPGFNVPIKHIATPKAAPGTVQYPPATTVTDPKNMGSTVAAFQAAAPIPSNFYYYPADGDLWPIINARLGGTPRARIVDPKNNQNVPMAVASMADIGKLNGIISLRDFDQWVKAKKPLRLPVGGWNDVSGPVPAANGSIR